MKSLRNHLAFIIPLISMLLTFVIYLFTNNVINDYKTSISKDYSIVIVTHTPLFKEKLAT
ncbi:MAG: cell division protein FtsX, partial [Campylobacteraceae bacterium]|nr:cell division protein FtsX [Campylobacteraceae bacterium]